jgi:uncharacterized radical SAM superfamily Fe-S cluster-containing enzyme
MVSLGYTESVCPHCLQRIQAEKVAWGEDVYLVKTCPEHGTFRTVIWRGQPSYQSWKKEKLPSQPPVCASEIVKGCPFDCGLCPDHRQHTCCVVFEVTSHCNLSCPVCFAVAGQPAADPDITEIKNRYEKLMASGGPFNIQLSGGEPSLRDDLPEIIRLGHSLGFNFIQMNTNGIRLAQDVPYIKELKKADLNCVFLQFDGMNDQIYTTLRGAELLALKQEAIARCREHKIGVVLVPTIVPGVNNTNIGEIIRYAVEHTPAVRGVHFQPVSYFGRYPKDPDDSKRMTLPELMREIEYQTGGQMKVTDFFPPGGENAYCSFHGNYIVMPDGQLKPWGEKKQDACCGPQYAAEGARKARSFVAKRWAAPQGRKQAAQGPTCCSVITDSMDEFLNRLEEYSFCISAMAFQDAWNMDLERLKDCFIHVVHPDNRIIPFCAYNLTDIDGTGLYRPRGM